MELEPIEALRSRALAGDNDARVRMGNRYLAGVTVEKDPEEAKRWYLLAGDSGTMDGFMALGLYYSGACVPRDVPKAMEAYERAALLGHAGAQLNLGLFHWEGDGVPQDYAQAAKWVRMAAEQGEAQGLFLMGAMWSDGLGMKEDLAEALSAYEAAVQKGWAPAMLNLGNMYLYGQGIPKDEMRATDYYRQGAALNHPPSVCNLAANFLLGRGVDKDPSEGMRLMRQAAILGYAVAQMNMAGCLAYGQDCRKSIPLSYAWATFASAASQKARDFLASNLAEITKAQLASGEKHIKALRDEMMATPPPVHPFVNDGT